MNKVSKRTFAGLAVLLCIASSAQADKFAGEFMNLGVGARALGMAGAFSAVANDASALYWNPAGISGFEKRQALFMHAEQFGSLINYNYASFVSPTTMFASADREASFGIALIHLGGEKTPITNHLSHEENNGVPGFQPEDGDKLIFGSLPMEGNNDFALFTSYAMNTTYGRVGGSVKLIYSDQVAGFSATGIGLDLGYLRRDVLVEHFDVGVKLQDITGTYISWSTGTNEFIAPSVKLGLAYKILSDAMRGSMLLTADGDFFFENRQRSSQFWVGSSSVDLRFGAEVRFQEVVAVRGGFDTEHPTAGAGFQMGFVGESALGFDYAYLHHDAFESTHRISGHIDF